MERRSFLKGILGVPLVGKAIQAESKKPAKIEKSNELDVPPQWLQWRRNGKYIYPNGKKLILKDD